MKLKRERITNVEKTTKERNYFKLTEKEKLHIKNIIKKHLKRYKTIQAVFIFGSFVNRNYFQDVDIAIIGKLTRDNISKLETELSKATGFEVNIKSFDKLNDIPDLFKFSIFQGEMLLEKDLGIQNFANYRHNVILQGIDFLEFRSKKWW